MKIFLITMLLTLTCGISFAETVYEKKDDYTLKTTITEQVETIKEITLLELKTEEVRKKEEISNNYQNYLERNTALKDELKVIQDKIQEAEKLGIKEKVWVE